MIEQILQWLEGIGFIGLFAAMFLEGSSLPFPGIAVVLAYGYILPVNYLNTALIAAGMSVVYSIASLIPYYLGSKLDGLRQKHNQKGMTKAKELFVRYGGWSVALSRPFGIGNYISYVAGISKMKMTPYLLLTFAGIYPWSYVILLLGNYFNGSYEAFKSFYDKNSIYLYGAIAIVLGMVTLYFFIRHKRNNKNTTVREGGQTIE